MITSPILMVCLHHKLSRTSKSPLMHARAYSTRYISMSFPQHRRQRCGKLHVPIHYHIGIRNFQALHQTLSNYHKSRASQSGQFWTKVTTFLMCHLRSGNSIQSMFGWSRSFGDSCLTKLAQETSILNIGAVSSLSSDPESYTSWNLRGTWLSTVKIQKY